VLERGHLDLMDARLPRAGGALVLPGELDAVEEVAEAGGALPRPARRRGASHPAGDLSFWLWTHWPTSLRMAPMRPEERFAANLRRLRTEAGLSQEGLAERTGLHPTEISRLERAVREPRLGTMVRVARGLGVKVERLVSGIR
jgi:DNA-binding XRE family transcriptional regulator